MESADETCNEKAGRIVQDDTESNDGGCGYPTGDIPSSDMQPERARVSTVCWPSEAPSGCVFAHLIQQEVSTSLSMMLRLVMEFERIPQEAHLQSTRSQMMKYPRKCTFVHLRHVY